MKILVCPGMHSAELTDQFIAALQQPIDIHVFPSERLPVYSPQHVIDFFAEIADPRLIIAFSAGVVGAIAAARIWQRQGVSVRALIAIDGWGVPLFGDFPIHRISHDAFTHWTTPGSSEDSFYADPPVEHLTLWHSPQLVQGYSTSRLSAADFINRLIQRYEIQHLSQC